ncbi:hypothetical protein BX600DRAFT_412595 [Xylariales sp. PMI_506]|nr:hypothetical protein BX600DRAFT_412595 [Xylariales sp. PMI_506]
MAFLRQTWVLTSKNLRIVFIRHALATVIRAFILPIILATFLSFARNLLASPAVYGIGASTPVRSLQDALGVASSTGRETVVFVNNGLAGGDIDKVIDTLAGMVTDAGKRATRLSSAADLQTVCPSTLRGVTTCYGAVVFNSSPNEGTGGMWNYTLRADGALGVSIDTTKTTNDAEIYALPLQRAVDSTILNLDTTDGRSTLPSVVDEYPFTTLTQAERAEKIRQAYQSSVSNWAAVAFFTSMIGVSYHMTGFIATERETGMTQLLDAMMLTRNPWEAQAARFLSHHLSFTLLYLPGWVISSLIIGRGVFTSTSLAIPLIYFILAGFSLTSMSLLMGSFFKRSQLSGVLSTMVFCLLGILAQSLTSPKNGAVAVLSLLFAPCNFVYFLTYVARFEKLLQPTQLAQAGPSSPWTLPGIVLWVFLILQIFAYPLIGAFVERWLHDTSIKGRTILRGQSSSSAPEAAVTLEGFTKIYSPSLFRRLLSFISKPKEPVIAVDNLSLSVTRGQILALLGANGSGKSTTLDSIAGTSKSTSGHITIDGTGGLGVAPQRNVLWDELTVFEHIRIFNRLKAPGAPSSRADIKELIKSIDLGSKVKAFSRTLSGGQKRKLQLGMMLTGGSAVCCVDEVSSGIDPLSRRKVWDILLAERGKRTILLTTHFLDEADLLADHIAILSKGTLRAEGSSAELKDRLGAGYRIHLFNSHDIKEAPEVEGVTRTISFDVISYVAQTSAAAAEVIRTLENAGLHDYKYSGPTIEDVFLQVAEEVKGEGSVEREPQNPPTAPTEKQVGVEDVSAVEGSDKEDLGLLSGRRIGLGAQIWVLFRKRCTIFKTNWFNYLAAFIIPIIAAGLTTLFVANQTSPSCTPIIQNTVSSTTTSNLYSNIFLVTGPSSDFTNTTELVELLLPVFENEINSITGGSSPSTANSTASIAKSLHLVNSIDDFNNFIVQYRRNVTPAGWWLGDSSSTPTVAYKADSLSVYTSILGQNLLNVLLSNTSIATDFSPFADPWVPGTGNSLQMLVYMCLALSAYPAFFGLYPNIERRRNVRGLQYSNGVRSFPLWVAYIIFDFGIVLVSMAIVTILFVTLSNVWYHVAYLYLIFILYGLAATLLAYVISLFCKSQLSAYAFAAAGEVVGFLVYLIAYLCVLTYAPVNKIDVDINLVHYIISAVFPIGSIVRTMFVTLNVFSAACSGQELQPSPTAMTAYGAPILYLIVQSLLLFGVLLWHDSGAGINIFHRFTQKSIDPNADANISDEEVAHELTRVTSAIRSSDGLRVLHLTKSFGKTTAVENVTFGVQHGEVFALLGPNGAGKSTTISLIRGDIQPSRNGGDVFVENISVKRHRATARSHLGVCPQFDAIDSMTVKEHLQFYAKIRGVPDVEHNVRAVLRAVGLEAFSTRMAHALSGGNKRKLSLGIALMGNPSVVLLDEPSSGLDAAAKRIMWRTLSSIVPGRSILLTTHSMEEADALANRAGILAKRMLAMGTTENLRQRFGDALHVHLVSRTAPHSTPEEMERIRDWVAQTFPGAETEEKTYHGQMRFSVPASTVLASRQSASVPEGGGGSAVGQAIVILEENKAELGIEHYSVSPTTLDQVFLTIVGKHNVQEENYGTEKKSWWRR